MKHLKPYKVFEEFKDIDVGFDLSGDMYEDIFRKAPTKPTDPEYERRHGKAR